MNTENQLKGNYCTPKIERIQLDNEISLALESPPTYKLVKSTNLQEFNNENPFKIDLV
jgi:hypothetical protein